MRKEKRIYVILAVLALALFVFEFESEIDNDTTYRNLQASPIEGLIVNTTANVYLIPSEENKLEIEGNQDLIENLEIIQVGENLVVKMKKIYNPVKLLKLAYESSRPINIYVSGPDAKDIELINKDNFGLSRVYESNLAKMMVLKQPKLFTKINLKGATCNALRASNIM